MRKLGTIDLEVLTLAIKEKGTFNELFKFECEFIDGTIGILYRKTNEAKVQVNEVYTYTINDKGTIKIIPSDIIGREDSAKKGDLTFMSERLEYLQGNVTHLTGKVSHWNDSLKTVVDDLQVLFENLEVLQNEFEIDLLILFFLKIEITFNFPYFLPSTTSKNSLTS